MNVKIAEGLVGARSNLNMVNIPIRVYKEARHRQDTGTMERALGYADEFMGRADNYQKEAEKGIKEDTKQTREKEKLEREKIIEKQREEREKAEETAEKNSKIELDKVNVSEEEKALLEADNNTNYINKNEIAEKGKVQVIYTEKGEVSSIEQEASFSISV